MLIGILSRGPQLYSTQRLAEEVKAAGHEVSIIDHGACSMLIGEEGGELFQRGNPLRVPDVIIPRIGASVTAIGASIIAQLDLMGVPHMTSVYGLLLARDKMRSLQFLATHGIPTPRTVLASSGSEARRVARRVGDYPIVVKLLESTHGVGVVLSRNRYDLERTADAFVQLQGRVILQEYIEEAVGADIRALVVDGEIVAVMERRAAKGEFRANLHRGGSAQAITLSEEEEEIVLRSSDLLQLDVAGVDLIRSDRGALVMEINASPGLEGIENCTQVNVAGAIIKAAIRKVEK